jgi:preprotein translocase subunit YajC
MEFLLFLIFIFLLIYFIFNRIEEKNKENFEDRDN